MEAAVAWLQIFALDMEGNHDSLKTAGVPAEIRTEYLPNISLGPYR
jgi:hypothetical protein